ncbi:hypothetical protein L7F22_063259 [Adiantum nelumboides]|nr:hypothetical protein [Adiantum nelumboides]
MLTAAASSPLTLAPSLFSITAPFCNQLPDSLLLMRSSEPLPDVDRTNEPLEARQSINSASAACIERTAGYLERLCSESFRSQGGSNTQPGAAAEGMSARRSPSCYQLSGCPC